MVNMWNADTKIRAKSQRDRILNKLREAGEKGVTNIVLKDIAFRFGQAIHTLYMQGYIIKTEDLGDGVCRYTLVSEPDAEKSISNVKAIDLLLNEISNKYNGTITVDQLSELIPNIGLDVKRKKGYYTPAV